MKRSVILNFVFVQISFILQLPTGKNQPLLIRWNSFLVLDLFLEVSNRFITWIHIKVDLFASQRLDVHNNLTFRGFIHRYFDELRLANILMHDLLVGEQGSRLIENLVFDRELYHGTSQPFVNRLLGRHILFSSELLAVELRHQVVNFERIFVFQGLDSLFDSICSQALAFYLKYLTFKGLRCH